MNKPLQTIVDLCNNDTLMKSHDTLIKTYEQHMKAINDLRNAVKKSMTEAIASENFEALEQQKILLEHTKAYAEQLEGLPEFKPSKVKSKKS